MRFTGHLDLFRTLERTMRRADLSLAYSQGYHPHPKLTLASALPLGYTSEAEVAELWLEDEMPLGEVEARLKEAVPPGILVLGLEVLDVKAPKPQNLLTAAEFVVALPERQPELDGKVKELLAAEEIIRERRRKGKVKSYDLRPLIEALELLPEGEEGQPRLRMRLAAREGATGRPDEVLLALGVDPLTARVHRKALVFDET